ncbi:MAG: aminotransferase class I/II-fold pyridoxal phosphate-dependent enzyme, partial [Cyclobacteriaceae bacterium]
IYEHINFSGEHVSIASMPGMMERTVTVNGFSKGFAMTGWRLGYIAAPLSIAKACGKMQGQFTSGTNSIAQRAAIAALKGDMTPTQEMAKAYRRRRDLVLGLLKEIPGIKTYVPNGAFYIFPDVSDYFGKSDGEMQIKDAEDFCMYILKEAYVSLVTGDAFGAPQCVRLSYAASDEQLKEAIARMKKALAKLK